MKRNLSCDLCPLHNSVRKTRCVWGMGSLKAKVAIIGDAPGVVEDLQGLPIRWSLALAVRVWAMFRNVKH